MTQTGYLNQGKAPDGSYREWHIEYFNMVKNKNKFEYFKFCIALANDKYCRCTNMFFFAVLCSASGTAGSAAPIILTAPGSLLSMVF